MGAELFHADRRKDGQILNANNCFPQFCERVYKLNETGAKLEAYQEIVRSTYTGKVRLQHQHQLQNSCFLYPTSVVVHKLCDTDREAGMSFVTGTFVLYIMERQSPQTLCLPTKLCFISANIWTVNIRSTGQYNKSYSSTM